MTPQVVSEEATQEYEAAKRQAADDKKKRNEVGLSDEWRDWEGTGMSFFSKWSSLAIFVFLLWNCFKPTAGFRHKSASPPPNLISLHFVTCIPIQCLVLRKRREEKRSLPMRLPLAMKMMMTSESKSESLQPNKLSLTQCQTALPVRARWQRHFWAISDLASTLHIRKALIKFNMIFLGFEQLWFFWNFQTKIGNFLNLQLDSPSWKVFIEADQWKEEIRSRVRGNKGEQGTRPRIVRDWKFCHCFGLRDVFRFTFFFRVVWNACHESELLWAQLKFSFTNSLSFDSISVRVGENEALVPYY